MTAEILSFGPEGNQWHYSHSTKTYDLSRGSTKRLTIKPTAGPTETAISVAPELSALVIVDMQNSFLDPKCIDNPLGLEAIAPTVSMIDKCRELGIQVDELPWQRISYVTAT